MNQVNNNFAGIRIESSGNLIMYFSETSQHLNVNHLSPVDRLFNSLFDAVLSCFFCIWPFSSFQVGEYIDERNHNLLSNFSRPKLPSRIFT